MRGDHPGTHQNPQSYSEPIGQGQSSTVQREITPLQDRKKQPWGLYFWLLIAGAVTGTLGMFWHGNFTRIFGAPIPWGLVLAVGLNVLMLHYGGKAAAAKHRNFTVMGITAAWLGVMVTNFVAFFFPGTSMYFLPVPLSVNPFISAPVLFDRLWQLAIFLLLPAVTQMALSIMKSKKD